MIRTLCTGIGIAALLAVLTVSHATEAVSTSWKCAGDYGSMNHSKPINVDALAAQLNLSNAQTNKIREIVNDIATPMMAMEEKLQAYRAELHKLHQAEPIDKAALQTLGNKQARVLLDMLQIRSKTRAEINNVLTPEQFNQLRASHQRELAQ